MEIVALNHKIQKVLPEYIRSVHTQVEDGAKWIAILVLHVGTVGSVSDNSLAAMTEDNS
jgi:hypothetical protein